MPFGTPKSIELYPSIEATIARFKKEFEQIPEERKKLLNELALGIAQKLQSGTKADLVFICTHNSRRSQMAQIWAQTAAFYYEINSAFTYSGGTEATAFDPRAINALNEAGFRISKTTTGNNPIYEVRYSDHVSPLKCYSKVYSTEVNPAKGFFAVMTCAQADQNCPLVIGATLRIAIPYDDPKDFDRTAQEAAQYTERLHQIGQEMLYAFSLIQRKLNR